MKRFSKEWWENYWFYYKIHTIVGVIVMILLWYTIAEIVGRVEPDLEISYMGGIMTMPEQVESGRLWLSEQVDDINGDGRRYVFVNDLYIPKEIQNEYDYSMQQKAFLEIAAGDSRLYIMDMDALLSYHEVLMPLEQFVENVPDEVFEADGMAKAFLLNSELSEKLGLPEGYYVGVRMVSDADKDKKKVMDRVGQAEKLFKYLMTVQAQ